MPDGVTVKGPDGNTYQFPDGTTKESAIAYFKTKGVGSGAPDALAQAQAFTRSQIPKALIAGTDIPDPTEGRMAQGQAGQDPKYNDYMQQSGRMAAITAGSMAVPAMLPALGSGGGVLGFLGRTLLRSGASGVGAGVGNATGQAMEGQNPFSTEQLKETGKLAGFSAALSVPFEAIGGLAETKLGRGSINASMGGASRDMTYANPGRALLREEIHDVTTGDWSAYQSALRAGETPTEAAQAAGGRFAAVSQRINELTPRLGKLLNESPAKIPVANVIDKPLEDAAIEIIQNPALSDPEKMSAMGKLGDLQKSLKEGLGEEATPAQLQTIKQAVGNRVNWGGTSAITDDVKGAYRSVYGSLKEAIHRSVPGTADIDNRLTDLLGASSDLISAAKSEEAGKIPFSAVRVGQRELGRVLPATTNIPNAIPAVIPTGATLLEQLMAKGKVPQAGPNTAGLPFHPGAGLSKPNQ